MLMLSLLNETATLLLSIGTQWKVSGLEQEGFLASTYLSSPGIMPKANHNGNYNEIWMLLVVPVPQDLGRIVPNPNIQSRGTSLSPIGLFMSVGFRCPDPTLKYI